MKNLIKSCVLAAAMTLAAAVPSMTTNATAGEGSSTLPYIDNAGLTIIVDEYCSAQPSFVAYYLLINRSYVYQGDTGWIYSSYYNVTFPQWPYRTLPLALFAFSGREGDPMPTGPGFLRNMGGTRVNGTIESGWLTRPVEVDVAAE